MILLKRFGESPKAAKTGRLWAVGSSGIGLRGGGRASFGLAICRKIESLREKTAFNGVKESVVLQGGLPVIALRDISQPLRDKTEGGAKTAAARLRESVLAGQNRYCFHLGGREMSAGEAGEVVSRAG